MSNLTELFFGAFLVFMLVLIFKKLYRIYTLTKRINTVERKLSPEALEFFLKQHRDEFVDNYLKAVRADFSKCCVRKNLISIVHLAKAT